MTKNKRSPPHLKAATSLVLVDFGLVATGFGSYEIRAVVALAMWLVLRLVLPIREWPLSYGRVRASLQLTLRVSLWCLAGIVVVTLVSIALIRGFDWKFTLRPQNVHDPDDFLPWLLHAVVLAPLLEEFLYRGLVHRYTRGYFKKWEAIAISGLVFWLLHWLYFGFVTFPNHLFAGCLFAWCYERTRSLLAPTLLHAAGNLLLGLGDMAYHTWPGAFESVLGW
jgi:membrane protease YdiL (CAAX protease family)